MLNDEVPAAMAPVEARKNLQLLAGRPKLACIKRGIAQLEMRSEAVLADTLSHINNLYDYIYLVHAENPCYSHVWEAQCVWGMECHKKRKIRMYEAMFAIPAKSGYEKARIKSIEYAIVNIVTCERVTLVPSV